MARDFIPALRTAHSLNLQSVCFWNFPCSMFGPWLTAVAETAESRTSDEGLRSSLLVATKSEPRLNSFSPGQVIESLSCHWLPAPLAEAAVGS